MPIANLPGIFPLAYGKDDQRHIQLRYSYEGSPCDVWVVTLVRTHGACPPQLLVDGSDWDRSYIYAMEGRDS